jgi:hypothetical protein
MPRIFLSALHESRRRPLAVCAASVFALSAPMAAMAVNVTSCLDDGSPGTLRSVIAAASSGETVDLSGLMGCTASTITLQTGGSRILIPQSSLTIKGPSGSVFTIDGSALNTYYINYSNIFYHYGGGNLTIEHLTLTGGHESHKAIDGKGGCIYSTGNVYLTSATVTSCSAYSRYMVGKGGGVYAKGNVTLTGSTLSNNSTTGNVGRGGGVYAKGTLKLYVSHLSGNSVNTAGDAKGGGVYALNDLTTQLSTVSGNSATSSLGEASGGGIYARGVTYLETTVVSSNSVNGYTGSRGGGMFARNALTLQVSALTDNKAHGATPQGGGAYTTSNFNSNYSTISGNHAYGVLASAGGLFLEGAYNSIDKSTVSNNISDGRYGGIDAVTYPTASAIFQASNSTISGNHAAFGVGAAYVNSGTIDFFNSTIASNSSGGGTPGLELSSATDPIAVTLKSNLMSNNTYGATENDLRLTGGNAITINGGNLAAPANNLVRFTINFSLLPTDTLSDCPRLGRLRNNGGLTWTHALLSHSVAIDKGNNAFGSSYDQRGKASVNGTLDYTRFSGMGAMADIGAYEVQHNDIVYNDDFDGCPPLS